MSADNPTSDDLRTIARNMMVDGWVSRSRTLENAADVMELLRSENEQMRAALVDMLHLIEEHGSKAMLAHTTRIMKARAASVKDGAK